MNDFSISFTVPGRPVGKGRPRFSNGRAYTDQQTKEYEEEVAWRFMTAKRSKMLAQTFWERVKEAPVAITITAFYPVPKSDSKKKRTEKLENYIRPTIKPDVDNVVKAILDGLNGLAYKDDKQVFQLVAMKRYAADPRVDVALVYDRCLP